MAPVRGATSKQTTRFGLAGGKAQTKMVPEEDHVYPNKQMNDLNI